MRQKTKWPKILLLMFLICTLCYGCNGLESPEDLLHSGNTQESNSSKDVLPDSDSIDAAKTPVEFTPEAIPPYSGNAFVPVNSNIPFFTEEELTTTSFEFYSELDEKGRCGSAYSCVGPDLMPTKERGSIGNVKPSGWQTKKYDNVDGHYLYNRCHLIGYQLTAENANANNLITGTRYLNIQGMLPFENMVADYIKETGNHVLYRVSPIFEAENLVADGVLLEAYSVEDQGEGISFCVYAYNVQPGITINYKDGTSTQAPLPESTAEGTTYILNTGTQKFHLPTCPSAKEIKDNHKAEYTGDRQTLIDFGYEPCKRCNP